ncbi:hypothetical protein ACIBPB_03765 [Micromonospora sp. NPDC049836]|uniref:hypothetical protein n=1 Tax=Micromonospora sp. NPDC049836 TaxID=3364274 RepID=UPI0037A721AA
MTVTATAPAPAGSRLSTADTHGIPRLDRLSVTDAIERHNVSGYVAFTMGARIRSEADVDAVASTWPPMSPEQIADLDRWCARVAATSARTLAEWWGISLATAEQVRDLMAGGA